MTRRDRLMIMVVLAAGALVGFWMLVLTPQRQAASEAKAQVETARTALTSAQARVTSGKAAQAAFRRDRATIVKIGRAVPESDDIPTLITQLEAIAKRNGVYFVKYSVEAGAAAGGDAAPAAPDAAAGDASAPSSSTQVPQAGADAKGKNSSTDAVAPLYPPGSVQMTGGLGRTPIAIGLRGTYFNLERYLRAVQRFAVMSAKQESAKGRLMVVDGFVYKTSDLVFRSNDLKSATTERYLEADLAASVYFAPPLSTPSGSAAAAPAPGVATPAAGTPPTTTSTGTATVGGLR